MAKHRKALLPILGIVGLLALGGCTNAAYRKSADGVSYGAIKDRTPLVENMDQHFTIEQTNKLFLDDLPTASKAEEFLGVTGEAERGAPIMSLKRSLEWAVNQSRPYQLQKEQLYLVALGMTLARHQFAPIFGANANITRTVTTAQVQDYIPDPNNPNQMIPVLSDTLSETRTVTAHTDATFNLLLRDGAQLTTSFTTDFLRYLAGDPRATSSSELLGTIVQPLLRGAGYKVTMENLTQAERNLIYSMRDFTVFRKNFTVQAASAYYQVLQSRDVARNSYSNLRNSRRNAERTRALAREGRVAQGDLGRLEQQVLGAESQWIAAVNAYRQALDRLHEQIGVPVEVNFVLDDKELEDLKIVHPSLSVDDSIKVALATRLDYQNSHERFEDAERKIGVAANALRAQVDLMASAGLDSDQVMATRFAVPQIDRYHWNAGLNLNLPLDRVAERNAYRTALITREQARRALEQQEDDIRLQVRDSWRALEQAKRNYEISEIGVKVAERRVEEQNLLAELGRARAQDQVDAQNDLANSRNQRTQALVGHVIARLQFFVNLGILYIKDDGEWESVADAKTR